MSSQSTWDLTPLYRSDTDPQIDRDLTSATKEVGKFARKWRTRTDYLSEPTVLNQVLDELEYIFRHSGTSAKAGYYFSLRSAQDQTDPNIRARLTQVGDVAKKNDLTLQFLFLNLGKISSSKQKLFLGSKALIKYHNFIKSLFAESKHMLSEPEERVLRLLSTSAFDRWDRMLSGLIAKEEREVLAEDGTVVSLTFSGLDTLLESQNKKVRDSAGAAINDILAANLEVAENEINALLESKKVVDELRGFSRPDQSRHLSDDVDSEVVDCLVDVVSANFNLSRRFYRLKALLLGQKTLSYHERGVEIGDLGGEYPYPKASDLVQASLEELDTEFAQIFKQFVKHKQIDAFPRKNKSGGAFCAYDSLTTPTYILLNHTNKLSDVLTIAHEVGHGINDELVRKSQNSLNFGTSLATAEVASTFMEDFVLRRLLSEASDERRLAIMLMRLDRDVATIFRQIAAYRFEQELHRAYRQKGYLSKEEIGSLFSVQMHAYMGPSVTQDPGSENWWVYWGHFRNFFYVYSYASGLLISKSLQAAVQAEPAYVNKVKEFLSAGTSASPREIFAKMDIDITDQAFWTRGIKQVSSDLAAAEKLARKLGKL